MARSTPESPGSTNGAHGATTHPQSGAPRVTLATLAKMAQAGEPFACLTCYDATTARWLARGGVHVLLVGDTAAEVILGFSRTIDMPLDVLIALTAGVKRGAPDRVVMGDMPFMSYQADDAEAIRNAGRFIRDGLADIVKIEADESFAPLVEKLTRAGIPVCGHVGSKPQHAALTSGYTAAGRTDDAADQIVRDARALQDAGAKMLLIEAVPPETTRKVLDATRVPLIGIGAGAECHGQVMVLQDLLGMTDHPPRFVEPLAALGPQFEAASRQWTRRVRERSIGGRAYTMKNDGEAAPVPSTGRSAKPRR